MTAFYNEIDPYAAQWLRNLIDAGYIAPGVVDERSIEDVEPAELARYTQCHFFAGIGGWSHALRLAGWPDDRPVWTGSCPCRPFSAAGKGGGFTDERHLWPAFHHLIEKCRPSVVFGEQVTSSAEWIRLVRCDMEAMGYAIGHQQPRQEPCGGEARRVGRQRQSFSWDGGWQQALARFRVMDDGISRCVAATDAARNAIVPQVAQTFIEAYLEC